MSEEEPSEEGGLSSDLTDILGDLPTPDGLPIPGPVKKRLWQTLGHLLTGVANVPVALLEAWAKSIRTKGEARDLVTMSAARAATKHIEGDEAIGERAANYFAGHIIQEQCNRESVYKLAVLEITGPASGNDNGNGNDQ